MDKLEKIKKIGSIYNEYDYYVKAKDDAIAKRDLVIEQNEYGEISLSYRFIVIQSDPQAERLFFNIADPDLVQKIFLTIQQYYHDKTQALERELLSFKLDDTEEKEKTKGI